MQRPSLLWPFMPQARVSKTAFNGFGGTKDLLDGAKVVVELVRAEKGNYENGLWIEATKRMQGEYQRSYGSFTRQQLSEISSSGLIRINAL